MKIIPNPKLKIRAIDKTITQDPDSALPDLPFSWAIVGQRGSGKTSKLIQLLTHREYFFRKFDKIFIVSSTLYTDKKWQDHVNLDKLAGISVEFDEDIILDFAEQAEIAAHEGLHSCLIIDDFAMELGKSKALIRTILKGRHIHLSTFLLTQKFSLLNSAIRNNTECYTLYPTSSARELDFIKKELLEPMLEDKEVRDVINATFKSGDPRSFLFINKRHLIKDKQFYHYFNRIVFNDE